jgi:hypothetical protein
MTLTNQCSVNVLLCDVLDDICPYGSIVQRDAKPNPFLHINKPDRPSYAL